MTKGAESNLGSDNIFIILIVVIVSQVYTYAKTYQIAQFKYEPIIARRL